MEKFDAKSFVAMQSIVGKHLVNIFKQLDFYVINFGDEDIEYSLHTYAPPRIGYESKILLTGTDEYYDKNYKLLSEEDYEKDELHTQSLLALTTRRVKKFLKDVRVEKVEVSSYADIKIIFENGACIDIFPNCAELNCEHYRFFKCNDFSFPHYVIRQKKNTLYLEIV